MAWRWRSGVQSLAARSPPQPVWQRHPCLISARGRRFGGLTSKCWGGLCGSSPSWRSRSALLRIAERWRCNRLAICEAEFVGHKVTSSRSSSSVQRDMADLGHGGPSAWCHACRFVWHHFGDCALAASAKSEPLANQRAPDNLSMRVIEFRVSAQWVLARIPLGEKSAGEFLARRPRRIPDATQDSVRSCSLGFAVAAISDGSLQRACKAQLSQIRTRYSRIIRLVPSHEDCRLPLNEGLLPANRLAQNQRR